MFKQNVIQKKFGYDFWSNMIILLYSDIFLFLKGSTNCKPLNKINLDILAMDDLGYLQGFFYVKPDKASGPNFMCIELILHVRAALNF